VQQSTSQLVSAAVRGAVEGASSLGQGSGDMTTKVLDALSSERGSSLLTLAISVACRSSTDALFSNLAQASADSGQPDMMQRLLHFAGARLPLLCSRACTCSDSDALMFCFADQAVLHIKWLEWLRLVLAIRESGGAAADNSQHPHICEGGHRGVHGEAGGDQ
jgi:hypothetical protein